MVALPGDGCGGSLLCSVVPTSAIPWGIPAGETPLDWIYVLKPKLEFSGRQLVLPSGGWAEHGAPSHVWELLPMLIPQRGREGGEAAGNELGDVCGDITHVHGDITQFHFR